MIIISSVYNDVQQRISKENGELTISDFNRISKLAENRIIDFITGKIEGNVLPQMYTTQKVRDFVAPLVEEYKAVPVNGRITRPEDYLLYENMYALSLKETGCDDEENSCDDNDEQEADSTGIVKTEIQLLNGDVFRIRAKSKIKNMKPSIEKPIAKEVGNFFEFSPDGLGGVVLEYVRYPVYAVAVGMMDDTYNIEVIDPAASTNYEWNENARAMLVDIMVDYFSNQVREVALKNMNAATAKTTP